MAKNSLKELLTEISTVKDQLNENATNTLSFIAAKTAKAAIDIEQNQKEPLQESADVDETVEETVDVSETKDSEVNEEVKDKKVLNEEEMDEPFEDEEGQETDEIVPDEDAPVDDIEVGDEDFPAEVDTGDEVVDDVDGPEVTVLDNITTFDELTDFLASQEELNIITFKDESDEDEEIDDVDDIPDVDDEVEESTDHSQMDELRGMYENLLIKFNKKAKMLESLDKKLKAKAKDLQLAEQKILSLNKEKKTLFENVKKAQQQLSDLAVSNANFSNSTALFLEANYTSDEFKEILKAFDDVSTVNESKRLYNIFRKGLLKERKESKEVKKITESLNEAKKVGQDKDTEKKIISETKKINSEGLNKINSMMFYGTKK
jgi:hypothetical protein